MPGGREAGDVADLGDDQHRGVAPDAADLAEHVTRSSALARASISRVVAVISRSKSQISDIRLSSRRREPVGQLEAGEELAAAFAEQVGVLGQDPVAGQQRVHAVLDRGAHPGQRRAVAQQLAQIAQLGRGDVRLGQQPGAQQVRERLGVDRVGLHPRGGDRPGAQRVREMHVIAGLLEQLGQPLPAVGRLQRDVRRRPGSPSSSRNVSRSLTIRRDSVSSPCSSMIAICERRRCRSMPTQRVALAHGRSSSRIVRPRGRNPRGLEPCGSGRRADFLPPGRRTPPGPPEPARPFMTSRDCLET